MDTKIRYGKPKMTDLPEELGRSIIKTIMNTPPSDGKEAERKAEEVEKRIIAARNKSK